MVQAQSILAGDSASYGSTDSSSVDSTDSIPGLTGSASLSRDTLPVALELPVASPGAAPSPLGLRPGQRLGDYEIVAPIGRGGMGLVYEAIDVSLRRTVAIKILRPQRPGTQHAGRLLDEARAAANLKDPRFVTVHGIGQAALDGDREPVPFLVMERLYGQSLRAYFARGESFRAVALLFEQLLAGLAHAHDHGLVHHDLKPENVFVCEGNQLKILDLGLAGLLATPSSAPLRAAGVAILSAQRVGTESYMAPETWSGEPPTRAVDVWAVGLMLYQALAAGRHPFWDARRSREANLLRLADPDYLLPLRGERSDVPPGLDELLAAALRKQPDKRLQSAGDMLARLRAILAASELPPVPEAPVVSRSSRPRLSRRLSSGLASSVLVVAAIALWHTVNSGGSGSRGFTPQPLPLSPPEVLLANTPAAGPVQVVPVAEQPVTARSLPPTLLPTRRPLSAASKPAPLRKPGSAAKVVAAPPLPVPDTVPTAPPQSDKVATSPPDNADVRVRRYVLP